jgi:hypothetical protein
MYIYERANESNKRIGQALNEQQVVERTGYL